MKKIFFIVFVLVSNYSDAQFGYDNSKDLMRIKNTITVVVLDDYSSVYNERITYAVKKYWNFSRCIFVQGKDIEPYIADHQYSYLLRAHYKSDVLNQNRLAIAVNKKTKYTGLHLLDHVAYVLYDSGENESEFCIINLVQGLQNYLINAEAYKDIQGLNEMKRICNSKSSIIKTKTLYIYDEYLNGDITSHEKVNEIYNYNVEVVSKEKLEEAILRQNEDVVYYYITPNKDIFIITAKDGNFVYYNKYSTLKKGRVNEKDLQDLNKHLK
jgi:hypothetical protein